MKRYPRSGCACRRPSFSAISATGKGFHLKFYPKANHLMWQHNSIISKYCGFRTNHWSGYYCYLHKTCQNTNKHKIGADNAWNLWERYLQNYSTNRPNFFCNRLAYIARRAWCPQYPLFIPLSLSYKLILKSHCSFTARSITQEPLSWSSQHFYSLFKLPIGRAQYMYPFVFWLVRIPAGAVTKYLHSRLLQAFTHQ